MRRRLPDCRAIRMAACALIRAASRAVCMAVWVAACGARLELPPPATYEVAGLTADSAVIAAAQVDGQLKNPWGIAVGQNGLAWIASNASNSATLYDGNGLPQSIAIAIPPGLAGAAAPSAILLNPTISFPVSRNGASAASAFIVAGMGGTLAAWAPALDPGSAVTMADTGIDGVRYTGLALSGYGGNNYLYAADLRRRRIDVYDSTFSRVSLPGGFVDPGLPPGYAPFSVTARGARLYVAYAQVTGEHEQAGAGLGIISLFDSAGNFIARLVTGGRLNAPWGIAFAPADFPGFASAMLVANSGDGMINAYDADSGAWLGTLMRERDTALTLDGLHGLAFGSGINNAPAGALFFTAGPDGGQHGWYGRIDPVPRQ